MKSIFCDWLDREIIPTECKPVDKMTTCRDCFFREKTLKIISKHPPKHKEIEKQKPKVRSAVINRPKAETIETPKPRKLRRVKPRGPHVKSGKAEVAHLKQEFMKRSEALRGLYSFLKKMRENPGWKDSHKSKADPRASILIDLSKSQLLVEEYLTKKNAVHALPSALPYLKGPFPYPTFEDWLDHLAEASARGRKRFFQEPVRDIRPDIKNFLQDAWGEYQIKKGREPAPRELLERVDWYFGADRLSPIRTFNLHLQMIHGTQEEIDAIKKKVEEILEAEKVDIRFRKELKTCLFAYDLGEKKWIKKNIAAKQNDFLPRKQEYKIREMAKQKIKKARQIILNLEKRDFFWWHVP